MSGQPQERYTRVVLTGFMGAGKSTVGRLLAPLLGWHFLDADAALIEHTGSSIASLFDCHGEAQFREMEASILAELLEQEQMVIAMGGGALESASTRNRIAATPATFLVYLQASLAVSLQRCSGDEGSIRPVLVSPAGGQSSSLEQRYQARLLAYQTADLTVATEGRSPQQIAEAIAGIVLSPP